MSATVDIQTNKVIGALSVPIQSVTARTEEKKSGKKDDEGKKEENVSTTKKAPDEVVFVINGGKASMKKVVTGIQDQNYIEIKSGLASGDKVVVAPFKAITKLLKDKMAVVVKKEEDLYKADK
jgi:HlyD family secretion protein